MVAAVQHLVANEFLVFLEVFVVSKRLSVDLMMCPYFPMSSLLDLLENCHSVGLLVVAVEHCLTVEPSTSSCIYFFCFGTRFSPFHTIVK
jgi:hypothetical protein